MALYLDRHVLFKLSLSFETSKLLPVFSRTKLLSSAKQYISRNIVVLEHCYGVVGTIDSK